MTKADSERDRDMAAEMLELTDVSDSTLYVILNALRAEHSNLTQLYRSEKKNWDSLETNYLGSEQGRLLSNQCYELESVIERLSKILNERWKR